MNTDDVVQIAPEDARKYARQIVDEFTYELHHSVTDPVLDFSRVSGREIVKLIDHIQAVIEMAARGV